MGKRVEGSRDRKETVSLLASVVRSEVEDEEAAAGSHGAVRSLEG